jgi:SAM-dependent methyltransferase
MGREVDLLENYPKPKRDVAARGSGKTEADRAIARRFDKEFFDGDRSTGYGGFSYHPRFWQPVIPTLQAHFGLSAASSVLDVGCAKGFMLHDLAELIPGITVRGIDVSSYAIENAIESMRPHVSVADARELPFDDGSFDVVIAINTIHNLDRPDLIRALREIERVARRGAFVTVDAYRNEEERTRMEA